MKDTIKYRYEPAVIIDDDYRRITCKHIFDFELTREGDDLMVRELTITGHAGCIGHPKTISALVKGRKISELPMEELTEAACGLDSSCGQELAKAIEQIKKDKLPGAVNNQKG